MAFQFRCVIPDKPPLTELFVRDDSRVSPTEKRPPPRSLKDLLEMKLGTYLYRFLDPLERFVIPIVLFQGKLLAVRSFGRALSSNLIETVPGFQRKRKREKKPC